MTAQGSLTKGYENKEPHHMRKERLTSSLMR